MENFCKGALFGMIAGVCVGAIVVAKNKKLSNKVKEGMAVAEEKFNEVKTSLEEKLETNNCDCGSNNASGFLNSENEDYDKNTKNNFSKKNKNY